MENWKDSIGLCCPKSGLSQRIRKKDEKDSLNKVLHAYNCTRNDVTGFSLFYLMFGRSPRLTVDLMSGLLRAEPGLTHQGNAEKWPIAMKEA